MSVKGPNLQIAEFKQELGDLLNNSKLPYGAKLMILNEATMQVASLNAMSVEAERQEFEKEAKTDGQGV